MVNPISSTQSAQANQAVQSPPPKPQPQATQKAPLPSDTVTLKSTGNADNGGDSK